MEAMRKDLETGGYSVNVVAINVIGGESSQPGLTTRATFDLVQDVVDVNAWDLMGGGKDDIFIYREGGALAPGGYLYAFGDVSTNLSTPEGYGNVFDAIVTAHDLGPGTNCAGPTPGLQLPGDATQDAKLDLTDAVKVLNHLFLGAAEPLPCDGGTLDGEGNRALLDVNGDGAVNLSDPVHALNYLFGGGGPPAGGTDCTPIAGCPEVCAGKS
jgi:hypothetical protein